LRSSKFTFGKCVFIIYPNKRDAKSIRRAGKVNRTFAINPSRFRQESFFRKATGGSTFQSAGKFAPAGGLQNQSAGSWNKTANSFNPSAAFSGLTADSFAASSGSFGVPDFSFSQAAASFSVAGWSWGRGLLLGFNGNAYL
jgi:hypothetical protein